MKTDVVRWRLRNINRVRFAARSASSLAPLFDGLRRDGIAVGTFGDVFGDTSLFEAARTRAAALRDSEVRALRGRSPDPAKPYKAHLLREPLTLDDPWLAIALDERVLATVNRYLGLASYLRAVDLWLTFPSPGPPVATQLWHRDGDDVMNVKIFVYLSDVGPGDGPFCFAPRTHPRGSIRRNAADDGGGRSTDDQLAEVVPPEQWTVLTGAAGTVVLADTCGYHKQLKPETGERLLLMAQYTSARPVWPRAWAPGPIDESRLTPAQRLALGT